MHFYALYEYEIIPGEDEDSGNFQRINPSR